MGVEEQTKTEVNQQLKRLQDEYGEFTVHEETVENDVEFFEHGREMAEEGWIGDAGVWVTDDEDRVLMIRHEGSPNVWGIPGGGHQPGETIEETAQREVREETGIECSITDVNFARRKTVVSAQNPHERFYMLTVFFDAKYEEGDLSSSDDEVLEATWFEQSPENIDDFIQANVSKWKTDN